MRIVVVGAGLSGLTAAFYLRRYSPDAEVVVFEASDRLGGVIATEQQDEWLVEHGADCFSVNPPDALQLCEDLGIAHRLIEPLQQGRRAMISRGNQLWPVPEGFVLMRPTRLGQVMRSPLLSIAGKLRLAWERFVPARKSDADESLANFVRRRLGNEAFERLVQPLVAGIYTADAEKLSMQATMKQFVEIERKHGSLIAASLGRKQNQLERVSSGARYGQFRVFPEGMGALFSAIRNSLESDTIRFGTSIVSLQRQGTDGWSVTSSDGGQLQCDRVVLALPTFLAAELLRPTDTSVADELDSIEYASSAIVLLAVADEQVERMPDAFGFVVPAAEQRRILAGSFASHKFPGRSPAGQTLIRVFIGGALQPQLLNHSDDELVEIAKQELADLIGLRGQPLWSEVRRWNRAMPQYHVGHLQRVDRIVSALHERHPGIEVTGNGLHGVGVSLVVGAARRAAERLVHPNGESSV